MSAASSGGYARAACGGILFLQHVLVAVALKQVLACLLLQPMLVALPL